MLRYIVTKIVNRYGFVKSLDEHGNTCHWQKPVFFHFGDSRVVEYDNCMGEFYFTSDKTVRLNDVMYASFRAPRVDDVLMVEIGSDEQGRPRVMSWAYLLHYEEVDAKQPRCRSKDCTSILGYNDDRFCKNHDIRGYTEDDLYPFDEIKARAYAQFGDERLAYEAAMLDPRSFMQP